MKPGLIAIAFALACAAPTDSTRIEPPTDVAELRIVHPKVVRVTVTPLDTAVYPAVMAQYTAIARDGQGRTLQASSWRWESTDTTIATVSQSGLVTSRQVGNVVIRAIAFPPWRR